MPDFRGSPRRRGTNSPAHMNNLILLVGHYFPRSTSKRIAPVLYYRDNSSLLGRRGVGFMSAYHTPSAETNPLELEAMQRSPSSRRPRDKGPRENDCDRVIRRMRNIHAGEPNHTSPKKQVERIGTYNVRFRRTKSQLDAA